MVESQDELRGALDASTSSYVRPTLTGLALVYAVFGVATMLGENPPAIKNVLLASTFTGAALMAAARLWLVRRVLPPAAGNMALAAIACVVSMTSLTRLSLVGDPLVSAIVAVMLLLFGLVITRRRWLVLLVVIDLSGWSAIAFSAEWSAAWFRSGVGLVAAAIMAILLQRVRIQSLARAFESKRALEHALARTREAKRAENRARRAAEKASREKSQFLAHISHVVEMRENTYGTANTRLYVPPGI